MQFELNVGYANEDLLNDLKKTAKKLGVKTLTIAQYQEHGHYRFHTHIRHFGSWNKAVQLAGLSIHRDYRASTQQLFDNLRCLWIALGRQPYLSDLCPPLSRYTDRPYRRVFGNWTKALKAFVVWAKANNKEQKKVARTEDITPRKAGGRINSWRLRHQVMKRDNFCCQACGASPAKDPSVTLHLDHIIPVSKGGATVRDNLQTLCEKCNIGKSDIV